MAVVNVGIFRSCLHPPKTIYFKETKYTTMW